MVMRKTSHSFEERLLVAIDGIHAAATDDISWSVALERVCDFVGARAADLNKFDPQTLEYLAFHPARVDPFVLRYMADYMSDVRNENPRTTQIYLPMAEGGIVADSDVWSRSQLNAMPFFADFLQPWGTFDSLNTWVRRGTNGSPWVVLALHFGLEHCPPQEEERRRFSMVIPHIRRACGTEERLDRALQAVTDLHDALEGVKEAVMLLNREGRVVRSNRAAASVLKREPGLYMDAGEKLRLRNTRNADLFAAALFRCQSPESLLQVVDAAPTAQIQVEREGRAPLVLTVQPLPSGRRLRESAVAVVFIHGAEEVSLEAILSLRDVYGLTLAETRLVCGLVNGVSLKQLASQHHISYETARTHLRRVFSKTGTNRQAVLVKLAQSGLRV